MIRPQDIPGAGSAGEPLPADHAYFQGDSPNEIISTFIQGGKPDFSSQPWLIFDEDPIGSAKSDETFVAPGVGPTGVGKTYPQAGEGMGVHSVIPRVWKMGLDSWGSILGGGSKSQRATGEDNEGSTLMEPFAWNLDRVSVSAVQMPVPGAFADAAYLPSVFVT